MIFSEIVWATPEVPILKGKTQNVLCTMLQLATNYANRVARSYTIINMSVLKNKLFRESFSLSSFVAWEERCPAWAGGVPGAVPVIVFKAKVTESNGVLSALELHRVCGRTMTTITAAKITSTLYI